MMKKVGLSLLVCGLIFLGCGGGSNSEEDDNSTISTQNTSTVSNIGKVYGIVEDGYIKDATVYVDNKEINKTDENGKFDITNIENNTIFKIAGGIDTATNKEFKGVLYGIKTSDNNITISPLTSLVAKLWQKGIDYNTALEKVSKLVGIDAAKITEDLYGKKDSNVTINWKINSFLGILSEELNNSDILNTYDKLLEIYADSNETTLLNNIESNFTNIDNRVLGTLVNNLQNLDTLPINVNATINIASAQQDYEKGAVVALKGYRQDLVQTSKNGDVNYTVVLPAGTYRIYSEFSGSDDSIVAVWNVNNIPNVSVKNEKTSSTRPATLEINSSGIYTLSVHAEKSNQLVDANLSMIVVNTDSNKIAISTTRSLKLDENNTGEFIMENQIHTWRFNVDSTQAGLYRLNVTTDYNNYENPVKNFSVSITCDNKEVLSENEGTSRSDILAIPNIELNQTTTGCILTIKNTPNTYDQLGYYTIKLIKQ